jgi:hypothetical protein
MLDLGRTAWEAEGDGEKDQVGEGKAGSGGHGVHHAQRFGLQGDPF